MNYLVMKRVSMTSNIINCIYMIALVVLAGSEIGGIYFCFNGAEKLINGVSKVNSDSPSGGFEVLGGMFGSLSGVLIGAFIAALLVVTIIFLLIFIVQNIVGFIMYGKIKNEQLPYKKRNAAVLADGIVKCITSGFFQLVAVFVITGSDKQLLPVLFILPQTVVTVLAVISIVSYVKSK